MSVLKDAKSCQEKAIECAEAAQQGRYERWPVQALAPGTMMTSEASDRLIRGRVGELLRLCSQVWPDAVLPAMPWSAGRAGEEAGKEAARLPKPMPAEAAHLLGSETPSRLPAVGYSSASDSP